MPLVALSKRGQPVTTAVAANRCMHRSTIPPTISEVADDNHKPTCQLQQNVRGAKLVTEQERQKRSKCSCRRNLKAPFCILLSCSGERVGCSGLDGQTAVILGIALSNTAEKKLEDGTETRWCRVHSSESSSLKIMVPIQTKSLGTGRHARQCSPAQWT